MSRSSVDFDIAREIALALPGVEEGAAYGAPALKLRGQLLACVPANRSAEPHSLAVRIAFDDRAALLAEAPDVYYVTDHYAPYDAVLVRPSRVSHEVLRDLLGMAHRYVSRKAARRKPAPRRKSPKPAKKSC